MRAFFQRSITHALVLWGSMTLLHGAAMVALEETAEGSYKIEARIHVKASSRTAWTVLTDYAGISRFMSTVRSSRVAERNPGRVTVEQKSSYRAFLFKQSFRVTLAVKETPFGKIEFEDILKKDFKFYRGVWELRESAGGSDIRYGLEVALESRTPKFIVKMFMRDNAERLVNDLSREIESRASP